MRTNNAIKNIVISLGMYVALVVTSLLLRRVILQQFDLELVAYDGLLSNVFSLIGLAEMGAEGMFNWRIYQAYAQKNRERINRVMSLYRAFYRMLAWLVFLLCGIVFFLLPFLFAGKVQFWGPFKVMYILYAISALSSYLFAYWRILLIAGQKEYLATSAQTSLQIVGQFVKGAILLTTQNYLLYVACNTAITVCSNIRIMVYSRRENPAVQFSKVTWKDYRDEGMLRELRDVFIIKMINTSMYNIDNLMVTFLIETKMITYFTNYSMVGSYVMQLFGRLIWPIRGMVADLIYKEERETSYRIYRMLDMGWFYLSTMLFVCYAVVFQPAIVFLFGEEFLLSYAFVLMFSTQYYINMKMQIATVFRGAFSEYRVERRARTLGAVINFVLSIVLGRIWGLPGIILGTVISMLCLWNCNLIIVDKVFFGRSVIRCWLRESGLFLLACGELAIAWFFTRQIPYTFTGMILCGIIGVAVPTTINLIVFYRTPEFQDILGRSKRILQRKKLP